MVLVSATLPHEVLEMTHKFMTDPVRILVKRDELTLEVRPRNACRHGNGARVRAVCIRCSALSLALSKSLVGCC